MPTVCDPLAKIPEPETVHKRLGELVREERLLRRLLRLAMAARQENRLRCETGHPRETN